MNFIMNKFSYREEDNIEDLKKTFKRRFYNLIAYFLHLTLQILFNNEQKRVKSKIKF